MTPLLALAAKAISRMSRQFNLGNGSTWPGHIALMLDANIITHLIGQSNVQTILVVGTNGKTTTGRMLMTILQSNQKKIIQNISGANLLNGIASSLLLNTNSHGKLIADYAVFEVDENNLPIVLQHVTPKIIIVLNLFRDQLDRYGELDSIGKKWNKAFGKLPKETKLILNGDDPSIAYTARDVLAKVVYFGLRQIEKGTKELEHGADSLYCPQCGSKLQYKKVFYSHLGVWECLHCGFKRPEISFLDVLSPLPGLYNTYNTYAAALTAQELKIPQSIIEEGLRKVTPAFGRQEKLQVDEKYVHIFLSKNPISMNESLRTIHEMNAKHVLFVLNDRIPDGRDVSWIWDIHMEQYKDLFEKVTVSGDRTYDMALRLQYAEIKNILIEKNLTEAIKKSLLQMNAGETLYVLPTYSAMLEVRKIFTGRKIL